MTASFQKIERKINIFINNNPEWGGTYQYTQLIIKAVQKSFHKENVNFYYTHKIWDDDIVENNHHINLGLIETVISQILIILNITRLPKFLRKFLLPSFPSKFFDKNENWIFPSQDIISIICHGKTIVSINDLMHKYSKFKETSSFFRKLYRDYKFNKIAKNSHRILVDSNLGKKHVEETYGKFDNVRVQYFSALKNETTIDKNNYGKYIIYPAQYWEHKNHKKLLLAIRILKKKFKNIKLLLIGHKKKNFKKIKILVSQLGLENNVLFLGFVSDQEKANLIANARALVNPSFLGPTNIPQLEAFNYHCPVILSNVFASKEQCSNKVLYFDPFFEESIAKSIEKIWVSDEIYNLYKNKSIQISKKYSFQKFSEELIKNIF